MEYWRKVAFKISGDSSCWKLKPVCRVIGIARAELYGGVEIRVPSEKFVLMNATLDEGRVLCMQPTVSRPTLVQLTISHHEYAGIESRSYFGRLLEIAGFEQLTGGVRASISGYAVRQAFLAMDWLEKVE